MSVVVVVLANIKIGTSISSVEVIDVTYLGKAYKGITDPEHLKADTERHFWRTVIVIKHGGLPPRLRDLVFARGLFKGIEIANAIRGRAPR